MTQCERCNKKTKFLDVYTFWGISVCEQCMIGFEKIFEEWKKYKNNMPITFQTKCDP